MDLNKVLKYHVIAGLGNPLLDATVTLSDSNVLEKYNLKPDGQKEIESDELSDILEFLIREKYDITYNPGGCAQNTLRTVQKLVGHPSFCVLFGSLGVDKKGDILLRELNNAGVEPRYAKHSSHITGQAVALIKGDSRSLVAHLGAANIYTIKDFKTPENLKVMEEVYLVYIEGFFITHSVDVALEAIQLCRWHGVVVVFNICGAYVADVCPADLVSIACAADIVIGNQAELKALSLILGIKENNSDEMAVELHSVLKKKNDTVLFKLNQMGQFSKILIITQGKDSVLCVYGDNILVNYKVPYLDPTMIKDPTGAGDSFAAGFLVAFLQSKNLIDCLAFGCAVAQKVIQQVGLGLQNWEL